MDYKSTLKMPKTDFEMKGNLNIKEPKIQSDWLNNKIYQKVLEKNKNKPLFLLHDGPPYANGNIHIGHALNKTLKDIIVRWKNLSGYYSPYIPGWDTHGLPIELAMLKKRTDAKDDTTLFRRKQCYEYALEQIENQKKQFLRIGTLSDFKKIYRTLDHEFEINQLNLFLTMVKKNLIFRDKKPVYWSWSSQSALAEAEIEYKDVIDNSIYLSFNLLNNDVLGDDVNLLVWTTTPWTIPANLAIAVNPNFKYVLFNYQNKKYLISENRFDEIINKLEFNKNDITKIKTVNGGEIENLKYIHPIYNNKINSIILAEYVSDEDGTGLVHNAPDFGLDDYLACKKYGISPFSPIDKFGKFNQSINDERLINVFYQDSNEIIINWLKETNNLVKLEKINHRVACDWRTKKPVIYLATKQWFVNLKNISNDIINTLNNDVKSPFQKNVNRMIEMIKNRSEWCISRQRIWGVPIPIIFNENDEPLLDEKIISNIITILDKNGTDVWFDWPVEKFLLDEQIKSNQKFKKEQDIMDVWFDSGTSHQLFENTWNLSYPADVYLEGSDQYRGWFNSSLITGTIQNGKSPYKTIIQHGFTLDEKGLKMSKSIGNVVDPLKVFDTYGADVFRLWVASCEYSDDQRFGDTILKQIAEIYRRIRNTLFKYSLSIISDFKEENWQKKLSFEDQYVLTRLNSVLKFIDESYNNYNFSEIVKLINNFTNELSTWYFDIIKDEIYCGSDNSIRRYQIQTTIYTILHKLLIVLAPIIPHTTDEAYQFLPFKKYESIHLEDWSINLDYYLLDEVSMNNFSNFFKLKDNIYNAIELARNNNLIKKSNMVNLSLKSNPTSFDLKTLKFYLNVANVTIDKNQNDEILITPTTFKMCARCWNYYDQSDMHNTELCKRCEYVIRNN
ncbi:MAG: isoleucine--tRNA ligase [Ureaplasma sp.]|nr:isoleucine--tRNA ligase [Ureaplasma sp.]